MNNNPAFEFAIVLINYNTEDDILALIRKMGSFGPRILFLVYDNKPGDEFPEQLSRLSNEDLHIIYFSDNANPGYCRAVNYCFAHLRANYPTIPYIGLLNSDIEIDRAALVGCGYFLQQNPEYIAVNPLIYGSNGKVWFSGGHFREKQLAIESNLPTSISSDDCDFYNGCFVIFSNKILQFEYDESLFMYYDEFDLSRRIRQMGYKIKLNKEVSIVHHISRSLEGLDHLKAYYKTRNYLYVLKKHEFNRLLPAYQKLAWLGLACLKHRNYKSFKYMLRGIRDFKSGRMGKLVEA